MRSARSGAPWALLLETAAGTLRLEGDARHAEFDDLWAWGFEPHVGPAAPDVLVWSGDRLAGARLDELLDRAPRELALLFERAAPARAARALLRERGLTTRRELALWPAAGRVDQVFAVREKLPRPTSDARRFGVGLARLHGLRMAAPLARGRALLVAPGAGALARSGGRTTRLERTLAAIAARLDEPHAALEHLQASCGGTLEACTSAQASRAGWVVHLATRPEHGAALARGHDLLEYVRARCPGVPLPEPLARGPLEGLELVCERRLDGLPADRARLDRAACGRLAARAAEHLARLVVGPPEPLAQAELARRVDGWCARAGPVLGERAAAELAARLAARARERLTGARLPPVASHADLRPRHVVVSRDGTPRGYVHWSLGEQRGLPALDLVQLLAHLEAQRRREPLGRSLARLLAHEGSPPDATRPLEAYAALLGLSRRALYGLAWLAPLQLASIAGRFGDAPSASWFVDQFAPLEGASRSQVTS